MMALRSGLIHFAFILAGAIFASAAAAQDKLMTEAEVKAEYKKLAKEGARLLITTRR
jgi:hypothetical protein